MVFDIQKVPDESQTAPDGSQVRPIVSLKGGSLAHCSLLMGSISKAIKHKTVEEIWYFLEGKGKIWRKKGAYEETVTVESGVSIIIPQGTIFQFMNTGQCDLSFLCFTMPPWPGEGEAEIVKGPWTPILSTTQHR